VKLSQRVPRAGWPASRTCPPSPSPEDSSERPPGSTLLLLFSLEYSGEISFIRPFVFKGTHFTTMGYFSFLVSIIQDHLGLRRRICKITLIPQILEACSSQRDSYFLLRSSLTKCCISLKGHCHKINNFFEGLKNQISTFCCCLEKYFLRSCLLLGKHLLIQNHPPPPNKTGGNFLLQQVPLLNTQRCKCQFSSSIVD
jgi:hypothetical protein